MKARTYLKIVLFALVTAILVFPDQIMSLWPEERLWPVKFGPPMATVEAQSPERLQLQHPEGIQPVAKIEIFCDPATGNLIYTNVYKGGVWGFPNGCAKRP